MAETVRKISRPSRQHLAGDDFALIRRATLFGGLDDAALSEILADARVKTVSRNEVIFIHGEEATFFYLVLDGWVKLTRDTPSGNESVISLFTKGETFAEAAAIGMENYPVNAVATEPTRLLTFSAGAVREIFRHNSDYAMSVVVSMAKHMHKLVGQIEQLTSCTAGDRLVNFLLRLCPEDAEEAVIALPIEKSLVAQRLGMKPETLSRALAKLRRVGVETHGGEVRITDVEALRRTARMNIP